MKICDCETTLGETWDDPCGDVDDPKIDDYCCYMAYSHYNEKDLDMCPYDLDVRNGHGDMCWCTPARRISCRNDI